MFFLMLIILSGAGLIWLFYTKETKTPLETTLSPAFQLFGKTTKSISSAITKVMPVDSIDEKEYGDVIAEKYGLGTDTSCKEYKYLNNIMRGLSPYIKKPFNYRVFIADDSAPNAFALPGGVIFVTKSLLVTLKSESELAAVLAHEMGHIEKSHCMDAVRFQLLSRKIGSESAGKLADIAMNLLLRHSFSKTQEGEADEYSYTLILNTKYNPSGVGKAFLSLMEYINDISHRQLKRANILRDYFSTHPEMEIRHEKYIESARIWWKKNPIEKRYAGVENLKIKISYYERSDFPNEWIKE
jgi:beta-barrel assembly-enhancing protease